MKHKTMDVIALDIGSSKIAAFYAEIDATKSTIISHILSSSEGIKSSLIVDQKKAEESITEAIYNLENDSSINVAKVIVSIANNNTKSFYIDTKIKLTESVISHSDISDLIGKALHNFENHDYAILHYFPIEFMLDDNVVDSPLSMMGKELTCRLHVIAVKDQVLINIANCLARQQIEVTSFIVANYAASIAALTDDEKSLGCIHIELGARSSAFIIFYNSQPIYQSQIPVGSWHITNDIAKAFSMPMNAAEKLKILYGNANDKPHDKNHIINFEYLFGADSYDFETNSITVGQLANIIHCRAEEIVKLIKVEYDKVDLDHLIARKIVITGGGSGLKGIKELISKVFNKYVRVGEHIKINGIAKDCNTILYTTVVGMITHVAQQRQKHYIIKSNTINTKASILKKIITWLKDNA